MPKTSVKKAVDKVRPGSRVRVHYPNSAHGRVIPGTFDGQVIAVDPKDRNRIQVLYLYSEVVWINRKTDHDETWNASAIATVDESLPLMMIGPKDGLGLEG